MVGYLIANPRSGHGYATKELVREAEARGVVVHVLQDGDDVPELARRAEADALGVAGGDGSLAPVAEVALERGLPFVCIPFGTRNHFARDVGLDRDDPIGALDAFVDREERSIDVGRANGRLFLNNVSLGLYARLVHRREHHRRRSEAFARLRAFAILVQNRAPIGITIDGQLIKPRVVLVSNNAYKLDFFSLGERERIDAGRCICTSQRGSSVAPGSSARRRGSRSAQRPAGSTPRWTASPRRWRRRSSSRSSRARYASCSRAAHARRISSWPGNAISSGRASRANQRSSSTSSAATGSPSPCTIHVTEKTCRPS
jgi:hypothetical protein